MASMHAHVVSFRAPQHSLSAQSNARLTVLNYKLSMKADWRLTTYEIVAAKDPCLVGKIQKEVLRTFYLEAGAPLRTRSREQRL